MDGIIQCICAICGRHYTYQRGKNCLKDKCNSCYIAGNRRKRKEKAVDLFGGGCQKCGYNITLKALSFHHVDPKIKEFNISVAHTISWDRYVKELNKCVLLCHNCHEEQHEGLWDLHELKRVILDESVAQIQIPTGRDPVYRKKVFNRKCLHCGEIFETNTHRKFCSSECYRISSRKVDRPSKDALEEAIQHNSWLELGRKYHVSDNAVRKWARQYGLL